MIVMKFGGTSVGDPERILAVERIVRSQLKSDPIVVVSALGGITDILIGIANDPKKTERSARTEKAIQRHYDMISELGLNPDIINKEIELLRSFVDGISGTLTSKRLDTMVSFGERMSARIVAAYLSGKGMRANAYDAYDLGLITDSNFGDADVLPEAYPKIKRSLSKESGIPVITGFIGKSKSGDITTLGRGGSDYTASIVGAAVHADEIQIWTDVNGIMTADPKVVKTAKNIDFVSYDEASELAILGAKVLHPKTILPAVEQNIPVRILNTFNIRHRGTVVLKGIKAKYRAASVVYKKNVQVINISTPKMFGAHGFLYKVFGVFEKHGISVDMISTSEVNISLTVDGKQKIDALVRDLKKVAEVEVRSNRAKVSLVGHNLAYVPNVLGRMFTALNGIEIEMVSSSTSEINQSFIVKEENMYNAVNKLHETFFSE